MSQKQEITLDRGKTFFYLTHGNYDIPSQIFKEIPKIARRLAESGKTTMLVRWGNFMERVFADCFFALRDEFPEVRLIKITHGAYGEDIYNKELSELTSLVISLNDKRQKIEDFMLQNSSAVICYMSRSDYRNSKLKKYSEKECRSFEVINLFSPVLSAAMETDLHRLIDADELSPEEIAARLSGWTPYIPFPIVNKTRNFKKVLEAFSMEYANDPEKIKEISMKLLSAMSYYAYILGWKDAENIDT